MDPEVSAPAPLWTLALLSLAPFPVAAADLAKLCGVCPLEASSGQTTRHRLNRGGDRALNNAIHTIALGLLNRPAG